MIKNILRLIFGIIPFTLGLLGILAFFGLIITKSNQKHSPWLLISVILISAIFMVFAYMIMKKPVNKIKETYLNKFPIDTHSTGYKYAGFKKRFIAGFLDFIILSPLFIIAWFTHYSSLLIYVCVFTLYCLLEYFYEYILLSWRGQTIGKLIMKIKVCQLNGNSIGPKISFYRTFVSLCIVIWAIAIHFISMHHIPNSVNNLTYSLKYQRYKNQL